MAELRALPTQLDRDAVTDSEQPFNFFRTPPRELVQRPSGDRRFAERLDGLRLMTQSFPAEVPDELVASLCEVRERERVELVRRPLGRVA